MFGDLLLTPHIPEQANWQQIQGAAHSDPPLARGLGQERRGACSTPSWRTCSATGSVAQPQPALGHAAGFQPEQQTEAHDRLTAKATFQPEGGLCCVCCYECRA